MTTTLDTDTLTTSDGVRLRVWEHGPADAATTLLLVHGWTLTTHTWDRVIDAVLSGSSVRIVRFDLRGHGESAAAPAGSATIERCADDVAELIAQRVPTGPIVLAGHSMGGMTIMALAERYPELFAARVAGAALVATSSGDLVAPTLGLPAPIASVANRVEFGVRGALANARGKRLSGNSRALRPGMRWLLFGTGPESRDVADTADWVAACNPSNMAGFRTSLAAHDRAHALTALRSIPVVVLAGLKDRLCPLPHARRIADALPDAELLLYSGAGHMLPLERTGEVADRITELVHAAEPVRH
ncbi:alpha/beta fold hydrolase [Saccharopolyspora gloriosae]|uniref:alpha/beta fold hydrolase n=1 Tax=Saccharopolyspora gloriosae TaxID=455344 RepID=UPI001FB5A646|nr:alpha/beta hydrolase [Saccharopolyspora gloriosae]